jgi:hypothetical protein
VADEAAADLRPTEGNPKNYACDGIDLRKLGLLELNGAAIRTGAMGMIVTILNGAYSASSDRIRHAATGWKWPDIDECNCVSKN